MPEDTSVHPTLFLILSPVFYLSPCPGQPRVLCSLPFIWAVWVLLVSCFHCRGARLPTLGTRRRPLRMRCFLSDTVSVLVSNCKGKCIDLVWHLGLGNLLSPQMWEAKYAPRYYVPWGIILGTYVVNPIILVSSSTFSYFLFLKPRYEPKLTSTPIARYPIFPQS